MDINFFDLEIKQQESPLDDIILYEKIDITILNKLISSSFLKSINRDYIPFSHEKQLLTEYKKNLNNGFVKVEYKRAIKYGRVYPVKSLSLCSFRKELRHTLAKNNYVDLDIVNCHPTILYYLIKDEIKCNYLKKYVNEREIILNDICNNYKCSRDIAKNFIIVILFGSALDTWKKENNIDLSINDLEFTIKFKKEISKITKFISYKNKNLKKIIKKEKDASILSYFLQEKEFLILSDIYKFLVDNNYINNNNAVLCFDGIMIEKNLYDNNLINKLEERIKNKFNIPLKFSVKDMNLDYKNLFSEININYDLYTTDDTALLFSDLTNNFIYNNDVLYYFNGIYWITDDKNYSRLKKYIIDTFQPIIIETINNIIKKLNIEELDLINNNKKEQLEQTKNEKVKAFKYLDNILKLKNIKKLEELVKNIIIRITNNDIEFNKKPNLFVFNNKIYDLITDSFIEPNKEDYINISCGYDYEDNYNKNKIEYLNEIIKTIFPDNEIKDYYLMILSTGLYGEQIENMIIATGHGGNGKGVINSLMLNTIGNYGYKLPSNILLSEIKPGANPTIANMHQKRFLLTCEPDSKYRIKSSVLKEITGEKTLNARQLYSENCKVELRNTTIMECNDLPLLDETNDAIIRRLRVVPFISSFVSKSIYDELEDKTNIFIGNSHYKTEEFQIEYRQALFEILRPYFQLFKNNNFQLINPPALCRDKTKNYLSSSDDLQQWFLSLYEKTDDKNLEPILFSSLLEEFKRSEFFNTLSKNDKRKFTKTYFYEKIESNHYLKNYCKKANTRYNNIKYNQPYIISFKFISYETNEVKNDLDL